MSSSTQPHIQAGVAGPALAGQPVSQPLKRLLRPGIKAILTEPLLHFAVLGAAIFLIADAHEKSVERHRIVIDEGTSRKIALTYEKQYGTAPNSEQLQALMDRYLEEEILYREGQSLNLDRDDEIVRRRIVQKYQFLQQDLAVIKQPSDAELAEFYRTHIETYRVPEKESFSHVYFSPDKGGDALAQARAAQVLQSLRAGQLSRAPEAGDRFPDLYDYSAVDVDGLKRLFGDSALPEAIAKAPIGEWSGPYQSGFGWHLVYVTARTPPQDAPLDEVRERVQADYMQRQRELHNAAVFERLKRKYTVVVLSGASDAQQ